ncbi:MAG: chemotaxis protein CheB [Syntrophobacteraceae bacterium]
MDKTKAEKATASERHESTASPPVVALGASAGGLDPLQEFFRHMPGDTGMAFMVIQHLSSQSKSMLGDLLQKHTPMKVATVEDVMKVEPNHVYLNPADKHVAIFNGVFHLTDPVRIPGTSFPIDHFFRSLADDLSERAICIILSGTGTDGSLGLKAVKEAGGMAIVQEPQQAKFDGMPQSAISTGHVDHVLPVERMAREVMSYARQPYLKVQQQHEPEDKSFASHMQKILLLIRSVTGSDFTQYKQSTIHRRVKRRMAIHKIEAIADYHRYLQENTTEVHQLFKELLILVTSFFRDPAVFEVLAEKVIPDILARNDEGQPVRVWVPGCATGEEAVSLALLFVEAGERLKMRPLNLQIFATDIDPEAVQRARAAEYSEAIGAEVSKERLMRFFIKKDHSYKLKSEIRDMIVFAVQDIVTNPPFSRLHLVSCRNLLIYLDPVLQGRILTLFHYTLNPDGYLLLGTSESIGTHSDLFAPVDIKSKIFRAKKMLSQQVGVKLPVGDVADGSPNDRGRSVYQAMDVRRTVEKALLDEYAPACVLIDENYEILYFQGQTDRYLSHPRGAPTFNLLKIVSETLRQRLPAALHKAFQQGGSTTLHGVRLKDDEGGGTVEVSVRPLPRSPEGPALAMVVFEEKPAPGAARKEKKKKTVAKEETDDPRITVLEQELRDTRENLQATIEQLEGANEELKSMNEELQSSNEELQSMNEEMMTAKEEQQSANEELATINAELHSRVNELTEVNDDITNLFASTDIGTIFMDSRLLIRRFTPSMTRFFNLIPADVGRSIMDIRSKVAYDDLHKDAEVVLATLQSTGRELQSEDGKWFSMHILPYRTRENRIDGVVATFVDITERKLAEQQMLGARLFAESIIDTIREGLLILDSDFKVVSANRSFYRRFQTTREETELKSIYDLGNGQWNIPRLRELLGKIVDENIAFEDFEVEHDTAPDGPVKLLLNARRLPGGDNQPERLLLAVEDVTR